MREPVAGLPFRLWFDALWSWWSLACSSTKPAPGQRPLQHRSITLLFSEREWFVHNQFVTSCVRRCIRAPNSCFKELRQFGNLLFVRLTCGALLVLFAFVVTSKTVAAADWPENYIVHEHSESPDGHYGVLVLSQQAAIDQYKTDGNTTYLVNLQTRKTLGEIRGTDYFENQNHRDLEVLWAPDSSTCVLEYDGRYGFDSVLVLELKGESFRQIDIGKHIQKTLDRLFEGYVNAYFRFGPDHKLKVRALSYTNPKALP
jgi:hypothetical protein